MMLLVMLLTTMTAWSETECPLAGSGTEDDPYLIETMSDFREMQLQSQTNDFEGVLL